MAARYIEWIADESTDMLEIAIAVAEMVYWTVGDRRLHHGLVCTASLRPRAYTGAKLVMRRRVALSG
jgi:phosphomannomutase